MPNTTCRLLSNGYKFQITDTNGVRLQPCCKWLGEVEENPLNFKQYRTMLSEVDATTDIRCRDCQYQEKNGLRKSWRQSSFDLVPEDAVTGDASYLEIQLDSICNGGCIICGPELSTYWQKEVFNIASPVTKLDKRNNVNNVLSNINLDHVQQIRILGGEPFLSSADIEILTLLKNPSLVNLVYTTNGSIYPSAKHVSLWEKFKSIRINLSLDGIGKRFNYIRYPLNWDTVVKNIDRMRQELAPNVKFSVNHTVNIFNLYYFDEFEQWQKDNFSKETLFNFNPAVGILSPQSVTPRLLMLIKDKYNNTSPVVNAILNDSLNPLSILQYIQPIDQRRASDWRTVFPEIKDCFI